MLSWMPAKRRAWFASDSSSATSPRLNGGRLLTAARTPTHPPGGRRVLDPREQLSKDPTALARCMSTITIERSSSGDAAFRAWTSGRAA